MPLLRIFLFVLFSLGFCRAVEPMGSTPLPQREAGFMPLGLYWAGEYAWRGKDGAIDWPKIETSLDDLKKRNVNAIWLTHVSSEEGATFSRKAALRGIYLVAAISELDGSVEHIRRGDHPALIKRILKAWGDAPKPIAWGLGDEPRTAYMPEMAAYAAAWRTALPGEPLATVIMHNDITAAGAAGFDALAADIYPFFSDGNPNSYMIAPYTAWTMNAKRLAALKSKPWMMGQAYQEPWGPFEVDDRGDIVYLPGGAPHWVAPTPAQIRWQALAAIAMANKGMFYFHYIHPTGGNPTAAPATLPAAVSKKTTSGAPMGMIHADGSPTAQFDAMGEAFAWISKRAALLAPLRASNLSEAWESQPIKAGGNIVSMLINPVTKQRWLLIVSSYDQPAGEPVRFTVGPHVTGFRAVAGGETAVLSPAGIFRSGEIRLAPATAALLECVVDKNNLPLGYADDFMSDRFQTDAIQVQNVRRHGDQVFSASGGEDPPNAFAVYDLQKWLPAVPVGGVRILTYDGAANPSDLRGAFWFSSSDQVHWTKLSANEFGKKITCSDRYLKVTLSWKQSSAAWAYGCLSEFSVVQWPHTVKP